MWIVIEVILLLIIFYLSGLFIKIMVVSKEKKQNKEKENQRRQEIQKNENIDLSSLKFCVEFKKEYGLDFFEFLNEHRFDKYSFYNSVKKSAGDNISDKYYEILFFNDKFYVSSLSILGYKNYIGIDYLLFSDLEETGWEKTDKLINTLKMYGLTDFKKKLYSIDDILYIERYSYAYDEVSYSYTSNKPSKLNLALTEAVWGTAAAVNKANQGGPNTTQKTENGYKFVFSEKSGLGELYIDKILLECSDELKALANKKSKVFYDQKMLNKAVSQSTTKTSSLDEIKKLKELLDMGAITQEEFDKKKGELLK